MGAAAIPANEQARLASLRSRAVLDTEPEAEFDEIVRKAAEICGVPIALVSLVDEHRQWFKAKVGIEANETPREVAYCAHAILGEGLFEVPESGLDPRFVDNPLRKEAGVEFYAGVPLATSDGHRIGTLCVVDHVPRRLTSAQRASLEVLAAQVVRLLEDRRPAPSTDAHEAPPEEEDRITFVDAQPASRIAVATVVFLAVASIGASLLVQASVSRAEHLRLAQASLRAERAFTSRAGEYDTLLRGAASLFAASEHVTEAEFQAYARSLALDEREQGVLGLGFVARVPRADADRFERAAAAEHPGFHIVSKSAGPELAVIRYVEPPGPNAAALGFDMRSSRERALALDAAARTRRVTMSERLVLRQDPRGGPGFLFLLPARSHTGAQIGWVFAVVRGRMLASGVGEAAGGSVITLLNDTPGAEPLRGPERPVSGRRIDSQVPMYGRTVWLSVIEGPGFGSFVERSAPYVVLFLGLAAALLSSALVAALRRLDSRSRLLASQMTASLRARSRELREVIDGTADLILAFDNEGKIKLANRAFRNVLGYTRAAREQMSVLTVVHESARPDFERVLADFERGTAAKKLETTFVSRDGAPIDVEGTLTHDTSGPAPITRAIFRDVSARNHAERALRAANTALERLASVDALTGVANRRTFDERLLEEFSRAKRHGTPLALVMLDVDHFKQFNDRYGHPEGDECLRRVGACLRTFSRRAGELGARYGGEEFALLLAGADEASALETAERLRLSIEALKLPHERHPLGIVTASLGLAVYDRARMSEAASLVLEADQALYEAKKTGRNRVVCITPQR